MSDAKITGQQSTQTASPEKFGSARAEFVQGPALGKVCSPAELVEFLSTVAAILRTHQGMITITPTMGNILVRNWNREVEGGGEEAIWGEGDRTVGHTPIDQILVDIKMKEVSKFLYDSNKNALVIELTSGKKVNVSLASFNLVSYNQAFLASGATTTTLVA